MASKKRPAAAVSPTARRVSEDLAFAGYMNRRDAAPVGQQGAKTARKKGADQAYTARGQNLPRPKGPTGSKKQQRAEGSKQVQRAQVENQRSKPANRDVYYADGQGAGIMSGALARKRQKQARDSKTRVVAGGKRMS